MLKRVLFTLFLLILIFGCKSDDGLKEIKVEYLDYNLDGVEVNEVVRDRWEVANYLTLKETANYKFNINKYGKSLKDGALPFINDNILTFNTDKGVVWYSLSVRKVIKFISSYNYIEKSITKNRLVLADNKKLMLSDISGNKTVWETQKTLSLIDRAYFKDDYLFLHGYDFNIVSLSLTNGSEIWSLKEGEKLKIDRTYGKYKNWKYPEGDFFKFNRTSNLAFTNGYLIIGTDRGYLYLFRLEDGEPAFEIKLTRPGNGPLATDQNNIYLGYPEGIFIISAESGELKTIIKLQRDARSLLFQGRYLYGMGKSSVYKINLDDYNDNKLITLGFGSPFPDSIFLAGGYLWKRPTSYYDSGFGFDGFNIEDFDKDTITFAKEGKGYALMEGAEGLVDKDKDLMRFKKNHLLEWNDHFILVEPDAIVAYKIVPQE